MAINVTATVRCDMCGREETLTLAESMRSGKVSEDAPRIIGRLPHWELLSRDGYPVCDYHIGDARVLCEACARRYKDQLDENRKAIESLFKG